MHYVYVNIERIWSVGSVVLTVRALRTGHQDIVVRIPVWAGDFYLLHNIQNVSVHHPCNTRVRQPRREANHSILYSTNFNTMSVVIHPHLHLSSSAHRDNFTLGLCPTCFELWGKGYLRILFLSIHYFVISASPPPSTR